MADRRVYDAIIVGAGIAGLTSAAYLTRAGHRTLLCEKQDVCGGLVTTFERDGFFFDGGIRAIENSGIVLPMLRDLGVDLEFVESQVSIGIEDKTVRLESEKSIESYQALLNDLFPGERDAIDAIVEQIRRAMQLLDVLYGIDNPAFLDMKRDRSYLLKMVLPRLPRYALTMLKIDRLSDPIAPYLERYTDNRSLIDMVAQHFFRSTPTFFALSYFSLYLDYLYPRGGTGRLPEALVAFIESRGGEIRTGTEIVAVDPEQRRVSDNSGREYAYRQLIWAADLKTLYARMSPESVADDAIRRTLLQRRADMEDKAGGDSVYTVYLSVDLDVSYFEPRMMSGHFFYTPSREGQSKAGPFPVGKSQDTIEDWLAQYLKLTTYEISCPAMRDSTLAPAGKTGLIISMLFDYGLVKHIEDSGWYDAFIARCEETITDVLDTAVFPGIKDAVIDRFSFTPLSIARRVGSTDGAITGWAFTNESIPVEHQLPKILRSVRTPIQGIYKAGQWSFSPSGLPTAILTGRLASDEVLKALTRAK